MYNKKQDRKWGYFYLTFLVGMFVIAHLYFGFALMNIMTIIFIVLMGIAILRVEDVIKD